MYRASSCVLRFTLYFVYLDFFSCSRTEMFCQIGVLKNFPKSVEKLHRRSLFFFIKLQNTYERLLLKPSVCLIKRWLQEKKDERRWHSYPIRLKNSSLKRFPTFLYWKIRNFLRNSLFKEIFKFKELSELGHFLGFLTKQKMCSNTEFHICFSRFYEKELNLIRFSWFSAWMTLIFWICIGVFVHG